MAKKTTNIFSFRLNPELITRVRRHGFSPKRLIEDALEKACKSQEKLRETSPEIYELNRKERMRLLK